MSKLKKKILDSIVSPIKKFQKGGLIGDDQDLNLYNVPRDHTVFDNPYENFNFDLPIDSDYTGKYEGDIDSKLDQYINDNPQDPVEEDPFDILDKEQKRLDDIDLIRDNTTFSDPELFVSDSLMVKQLREEIEEIDDFDFRIKGIADEKIKSDNLIFEQLESQEESNYRVKTSEELNQIEEEAKNRVSKKEYDNDGPFILTTSPVIIPNLPKMGKALAEFSRDVFDLIGSQFSGTTVGKDENGEEVLFFNSRDREFGRYEGGDALVKKEKMDILSAEKYPTFLDMSRTDLATFLNGGDAMTDKKIAAIKVDQDLEQRKLEESNFNGATRADIKKIGDELYVNINPSADLSWSFTNVSGLRQNLKQLETGARLEFEKNLETVENLSNYVRLKDVLKMTESPYSKHTDYLEWKEYYDNYLLDLQNDIVSSNLIAQQVGSSVLSDDLTISYKIAQNLEAYLKEEYGEDFLKTANREDSALSDYVRVVNRIEAAQKEFEELGELTKEAEIYKKNRELAIDNLDANLQQMSEDSRQRRNFGRAGAKIGSKGIESLVGLGRFLGLGMDAMTGSDISTTNAAKDSVLDGEVTSSNLQTSAIGKSYNIPELGVHIYYDDTGQISRVTDEDFYEVDLSNKTLEELSKLNHHGEDVEGNINRNLTWGDDFTFNSANFGEQVYDSTLDFIIMMAYGSASKGLGSAAFSSAIKNSTALQRVGKGLNAFSQTKVGKFGKNWLRMVPMTTGAYAGKMVEESIKSGNIYDPGEIFMAASLKLALENTIETIIPWEAAQIYDDVLTQSFKDGTFKKLLRIANSQPLESTALALAKYVPEVVSKSAGRTVMAGLDEGFEEFLAANLEPVTVNQFLNTRYQALFNNQIDEKDIIEGTLIGAASGMIMGASSAPGYLAKEFSNRKRLSYEMVNLVLQNPEQFNRLYEKHKETTDPETLKRAKVFYDAASKLARPVYDESKNVSKNFQQRYANLAFDSVLNQTMIDDHENKRGEALTPKELKDVRARKKYSDFKLKEMDVYLENGIDSNITLSDMIINNVGKDRYAAIHSFIDDNPNIQLHNEDGSVIEIESGLSKSLFELFKDEVASMKDQKLDSGQKLKQIESRVNYEISKLNKSLNNHKSKSKELSEKIKEAKAEYEQVKSKNEKSSEKSDSLYKKLKDKIFKKRSRRLEEVSEEANEELKAKNETIENPAVETLDVEDPDLENPGLSANLGINPTIETNDEEEPSDEELDSEDNDQTDIEDEVDDESDSIPEDVEDQTKDEQEFEEPIDTGDSSNSFDSNDNIDSSDSFDSEGVDETENYDSDDYDWEVQEEVETLFGEPANSGEEGSVRNRVDSVKEQSKALEGEITVAHLSRKYSENIVVVTSDGAIVTKITGVTYLSPSDTQNMKFDEDGVNNLDPDTIIGDDGNFKSVRFKFENLDDIMASDDKSVEHHWVTVHDFLLETNGKEEGHIILNGQKVSFKTGNKIFIPELFRAYGPDINLSTKLFETNTHGKKVTDYQVSDFIPVEVLTDTNSLGYVHSTAWVRGNRIFEIEDENNDVDQDLATMTRFLNFQAYRFNLLTGLEEDPNRTAKIYVRPDTGFPVLLTKEELAMGKGKLSNYPSLPLIFQDGDEFVALVPDENGNLVKTIVNFESVPNFKAATGVYWLGRKDKDVSGILYETQNVDSNHLSSSKKARNIVAFLLHSYLHNNMDNNPKYVELAKQVEQHLKLDILDKNLQKRKNNLNRLLKYYINPKLSDKNKPISKEHTSLIGLDTKKVNGKDVPVVKLFNSNNIGGLKLSSNTTIGEISLTISNVYMSISFRGYQSNTPIFLMNNKGDIESQNYREFVGENFYTKAEPVQTNMKDPNAIPRYSKTIARSIYLELDEPNVAVKEEVLETSNNPTTPIEEQGEVEATLNSIVPNFEKAPTETESKESNETGTNLFKTKIDQYNYTYNSETGEVIHNAKKGDKVETNEKQIGKVLAAYARENNLSTKEYNKHKYVKIGDRIVNYNTGNIVNSEQISNLFNDSVDTITTDTPSPILGLKDYSFFASFGAPNGFGDSKKIGGTNDRFDQAEQYKDTDFYTILEILPDGSKKLSIHFKHLELGSDRRGGHAGLVFLFDNSRKVNGKLVNSLLPIVEKFREDNFSKEGDRYRIKTNSISKMTLDELETEVEDPFKVLIFEVEGKSYIFNSKLGTVVDPQNGLVTDSNIISQVVSKYIESNPEASSSIANNLPLFNQLLKRLTELYPELSIRLATNPEFSDESNTVKHQNPQEDNQINYSLKAVNILSSDKAKQIFEKGKKNNWPLDKILTELQIPKEQKQIILNKNIENSNLYNLEQVEKNARTYLLKKVFEYLDNKKILNKYTNLSLSELVDLQNVKKDEIDNILNQVKKEEFDKSTIKDYQLSKIYSYLEYNHPEDFEEKGYEILYDLPINEIFEIIRRFHDKGKSFYIEFLEFDEVLNPENKYYKDNIEEAKSVRDFLEKEGILQNTKINLREEIITDLLAENSFVVEINTAKETLENYDMIDTTGEGNFELIEFIPDTTFEEEYDENGNIIGIRDVLSEKGKKQIEERENKRKPTQHYSYLSARDKNNESKYKDNPDWEYQELAIQTPDIINNNSEHTKDFSDGISNMLGWIRVWYNKKTGAVEIQEIQSGLFQKGRDKENLTKPYKVITRTPEIGFGEYGEPITEEFRTNEDKPKNQFLQLLNKNNNWVTFFVKSIIQDTAKQTITEVQESDVEAKVKELEKDGLLEIDCKGKLKAEKGLQTNFTKGGKWKLIKDLKGYPTHKEGGVDLTIGKNGVSIKNGNTEFTAKHGLVIPKN